MLFRSPTTVKRVTASWKILVGKPRGKATDLMIHAPGTRHCCYRSGGKRTCMPSFETRTDSPGETPEVQAGFRKGKGSRDQISNIHWIIEKAREFQKNIYFCFIDYTKAFNCVDHNKLWKILKEMGIPIHLTSLPRNLYAGREATVRTGHVNTD